jgi:hypothetical protein
VLSTCANTFAPPLKPESNHFAVEPCIVFQTSELFEGDVQAIPVSYQARGGEVLLQQSKQRYFHPTISRQFHRSTPRGVIMTGDVLRLGCWPMLGLLFSHHRLAFH